MKQGFLLIDGNNLGYANAAGKKLTIGDGAIETQAIYGTLRQIRPLIARYPQLTPLVLWDGRSWRYNVYPDYKGKRDKANPTTKHDIAQQDTRESFKKQAPHIKRGLELLGVRQMVAMNLEADDLAGVLVRRFQAQGKKVVMITGDKDWIQLVQEGVAWRDVQRDNLITYKNLSEKLGYEKVLKKDEDGIPVEKEWVPVPSARAWLEIKALMGDTSDNLPGVGGIGEKGAIDLLNKFSSVAEFLNRANLENLKLPKKLGDFASDETKIAAFQRNMMLMDLASKHIPAPADLRLTAGMLDPDGFQAFCEEFQFQSLLTDLDAWIEPFTEGGMRDAA